MRLKFSGARDGRPFDVGSGVNVRSAGIAASDIEPGGRYYDLLRAMIAGARADAQRDGVETACEAAKRYD